MHYKSKAFIEFSIKTDKQYINKQKRNDNK